MFLMMWYSVSEHCSHKKKMLPEGSEVKYNHHYYNTKGEKSQ